MARVKIEDVRFTDDTRVTLKSNQVVRPLDQRFRPRPGGGWWFGAVYAFGPGKSEENHRSASDALGCGLARIGLTSKQIDAEDVTEIHGALYGDSDLAVVGNAFRDILASRVHELESGTRDGQ